MDLDEMLATSNLPDEEKDRLADETVKKEVKKILAAKINQKVESYIDKVKMGEEGYRERYYSEKFMINGPQDVKEFGDKIKRSYCEGLQWVLSYYYKGCVSWDWYYPYHYAPFAQDLVNCDRLEITFELGTPARPFE